MSKADVVAELDRSAENAAFGVSVDVLTAVVVAVINAHQVRAATVVSALTRIIGATLALDPSPRRRERIAANLYQAIRLGAGLEVTAEPMKEGTDETDE